MKEFFRQHWLKCAIIILIIILITLFSQRKRILNHKITKAKMQIFEGIQDQDIDKVKSALDSILPHKNQIDTFFEK